MALSILQMLSTIFPNSAASESHIPSNVEGCSSKDTDISPVFEFPRAVSVEQARRLVYSLKDSYDANRALVLELLCCMSPHSLGLQVNWLSFMTSFALQKKPRTIFDSILYALYLSLDDNILIALLHVIWLQKRKWITCTVLYGIKNMQQFSFLSYPHRGIRIVAQNLHAYMCMYVRTYTVPKCSAWSSVQGGEGSRGIADLHSFGRWLYGTVERERGELEKLAAVQNFSLALAAWKFILPKLHTCGAQWWLECGTLPLYHTLVTSLSWRYFSHFICRLKRFIWGP